MLVYSFKESREKIKNKGSNEKSNVLLIYKEYNF